MEKELIGKKIISAEIIKLHPCEDLSSYSLEEIAEWSDKPILKLEMDDGSIFEVIADYGGYTGGSQDEYPRFIKVEKFAKKQDGEK